MSNELLLLGSVALVFGSLLVWLRLFGPDSLAGYSVFATLAGNIEVLILIEAFGLEQTLGNVMFASTFLITDILSETRSKAAATRAVNIGLAASVTFILVSQSWLLFTPSAADTMQPAIRQIFSNTPRLMLSSLAVYAVCQHLDVFLYHRIWDLTARLTGSRDKLLWLRNNGATLISQFINSVLFNFAAFGGSYPTATVWSFALAGYLIYVFTSLLDTPFVYLGRRIVRKYFPEG